MLIGKSNARNLGFTVIELVVTLALFGVLLALGIPAFTTFIQNTQIKNAADNVLNGLTIARAEAIHRNAPVRFQLVSNMTATCEISSTSASWIVSLDDAAGQCEIAPSETTAPRIIQKYAQQESSPRVTINATGGGMVIFTGLGRVSGAGTTQIDFAHANSVCEHVNAAGTSRCLRLLIGSGGGTKLCDPKVSSTTDPRHCS
ncbi:MAG: GspH/FimT family pseudopilin [Betaproteobacteria bacterium]|nr:GspH/FimT family pseudopilin [Betaproteobacteria bacterium]